MKVTHHSLPQWAALAVRGMAATSMLSLAFVAGCADSGGSAQAPATDSTATTDAGSSADADSGNMMADSGMYDSASEDGEMDYTDGAEEYGEETYGSEGDENDIYNTEEYAGPGDDGENYDSEDYAPDYTTPGEGDDTTTSPDDAALYPTDGSRPDDYREGTGDDPATPGSENYDGDSPNYDSGDAPDYGPGDSENADPTALYGDDGPEDPSYEGGGTGGERNGQQGAAPAADPPEFPAYQLVMGLRSGEYKDLAKYVSSRGRGDLLKIRGGKLSDADKERFKKLFENPQLAAPPRNKSGGRQIALRAGEEVVTLLVKKEGDAYKVAEMSIRKSSTRGRR